jgi:hypothetical protein
MLMAFVLNQTNVSETNEKISFTLKNDLAINVTIAAETSNLILQSGAAYRLEKTLGDKIYLIKRNESRKLLFVVKETHHNKILNISQFF